jgi:PDZ domain-containing protein
VNRFAISAAIISAAMSGSGPPQAMTIVQFDKVAATGDDASAVGKGVLGVGAINPPPQFNGALVARITPDSAAAQAGLQLQDLIVEADSRPISSATDLTTYVTSHRAGDRITFTVMRWNGRSFARIQLAATLASASGQGNLSAAVPAPGNDAAARRAAPAGTPAQGLANVSWTTFTDPYENAFTIEVPRGWKAVGGVVRKDPNPLWGRLVLRVLSPDRRTLIAVGDPDSVPYSAPIQARDYVRRFTERAMSGACLGLNISNVADLPDAVRFANSNSLGTDNQWSAAHATFTCNSDRQAGMSGEAIAVLQFQTSVRSGHAQVLAGFVTTTGQGEAADQLLNHIVSSLHQNDDWTARQQSTAESLARGAMARWQGEQRQFQQVDDAITDTAHYAAPDGQHYDLDDRPRYQWRTPDGRTVGTDTPTPPSPGSTRLQRLPAQ